MSSIVIQGDTSGSITVEAPSVAGTHTLTLPKATGNIATDATVGLGMKNRIINGGMVIDQRNAGASQTPTDGQYTVDRWQIWCDAASKLTTQQSTTVPTGHKNSLLITSSSAYSITSTQQFGLLQPIEGLNTYDLNWGSASASSVTLSFWVRSSLTGTFGGAIRNSSNNRFYVFSYTISSANTWEYKTVTITGDTSGTWLTTNGVGLYVYFSLGAGSSKVTTAGSWGNTAYYGVTGQQNLVSTSGATLYITGVQLEVGENATPFENRMYGTELALCQRYCQYGKFHGAGSAGGSGGSVPIVATLWKVPMRATPTISWVSGGTCGDGNGNSNITSLNFSNKMSSEGGQFGFVCSSSLSAQNVGVLMNEAILNVSAEL